MNDLTPPEKIWFDKKRAEIVAMLDQASRQRLGQLIVFGLEITFWKRGLEVCKPKPLEKYTVYIIGWFPPLWRIRTEGGSTYAPTLGLPSGGAAVDQDGLINGHEVKSGDKPAV